MADVPENPDAPKTGQLFPYDEPKEWIALAAVDMPDKTLAVDCGNCHGDKIVMHEDCSDCCGHNCENCDGTGKVKSNVPIPVGCAHYQHEYLLWLKELPGCKIGPEPCPQQAPFQFEGGDGLIMPMKWGAS